MQVIHQVAYLFLGWENIIIWIHLIFWKPLNQTSPGWGQWSWVIHWHCLYWCPGSDDDDDARNVDYDDDGDDYDDDDDGANANDDVEFDGKNADYLWSWGQV